MAGRKGKVKVSEPPKLRSLQPMLQALEDCDINDTDPDDVKYIGNCVTRHKPVGQGTSVYINEETKAVHGKGNSAEWSLHTEKEKKEFCEWIGREYIPPVKASKASSKPKVDKAKKAKEVLQISATDLF